MIRLGERAVDVALAILREDLQAALDALAAAAGDGIPAARPESFYPFQRALAKDGRCYVEAWSPRVDGFTADSESFLAGRTRCEATLKVRLTFVNRVQLSEEALARTAQRLAAAAVAVFVRSPLHEGPDFQLTLLPLDGVEIGNAKLDATGAGTIDVAQATVALRADLLERA